MRLLTWMGVPLGFCGCFMLLDNLWYSQTYLSEDLKRVNISSSQLLLLSGIPLLFQIIITTIINLIEDVLGDSLGILKALAVKIRQQLVLVSSLFMISFYLVTELGLLNDEQMKIVTIVNLVSVSFIYSGACINAITESRLMSLPGLILFASNVLLVWAILVKDFYYSLKI